MEAIPTVQLHVEPIHEPIQEAVTEVIFHCHVCMEAFVCEDIFRLHMDHHTAERPFECKICGVRFIDEVHLQKHSDLKHARGDVYEACSICGKLFHDKINLRSHMAVHSEERPFSCPTCGKSFKRKGELESHSVIHLGIKPYKCAMCNTSFTQRYSLKTHMRTHTGEKPFRCSICGKEFNRSSTVTLHMRQHTGEKPYQCTECEESFKLLRDLKKHMARVHGKDQKPRFRRVAMKRRKNLAAPSKESPKDKGKYECVICREEFNFVMEFNDHIKTHDVNSCYLCGQTLKSKTDKRRHVTRPVKLKESECFTCGVKFSKLDDFKLHMNGHSELCRQDECLRNAENLHCLSKKSVGSKQTPKVTGGDSEDEDGNLEEYSNDDDDNAEETDASPRQTDKRKSGNVPEGRKTTGAGMVTVKQEQIDDNDDPDTTILELVEGGEGFQLKAHNVTSAMKSELLKEYSESASDVSPGSTTAISDTDRSPKGKRSSPYKVARVSPPRTRGSLKVRFKEPNKEEETKRTLSNTIEHSISSCEDSPSKDGEDSDDCDLAETYCVYVKNILRLQPIDKQMALIKSINTTIGQFIND